jgi:hypothetical protein
MSQSKGRNHEALNVAHGRGGDCVYARLAAWERGGAVSERVFARLSCGLSQLLREDA